jgi:type 1 glutamine amidotransferase
MRIITQVAPYSDGPAGVHGVLGQAATALTELAESAGLTPVRVGDVREVPPDELASSGVLALFTIGETPFSPDQKHAVMESWRNGQLRVLGVHSATDACHTWPEYGEMVGARFDGHPWTQDFMIDVVDAEHPSTSHLGGRWDWHDEIYLFRELSPDASVLLHLASDQVDLSVKGGRVPDCGFPLAWCIDQQARHRQGDYQQGQEAGRTFYSALGHFPGAWETPAYLRHLAGGLAWLQERA